MLGLLAPLRSWYYGRESIVQYVVSTVSIRDLRLSQPCAAHVYTTHEGSEDITRSVHSKRIVVATLLMLSGSLIGCAQALRTDTATNPLQPAPGTSSSVVPKGDQAQPDAGASSVPAATEQAPVAQEGATTEAAPAEPAPVEQPAQAEPASEPTVNPALANVQLPSAADLEERWRQMQVDRQPFDAPRTFVSSGSEIVWWFDPIFGQFVPIGEIRGEFVAQASFRIKGQWIGALEIPYQVNQAYGIVVPEPIVQRMRNAGKGEWAEVFVYQTGDITQK